MKVSNEASSKNRLLQAAEVSDTAADPINFKPGSTGNLKHSPQNAARKEIVWSYWDNLVLLVEELSRDPHTVAPQVADFHVTQESLM